MGIEYKDVARVFGDTIAEVDVALQNPNMFGASVPEKKLIAKKDASNKMTFTADGGDASYNSVAVGAGGITGVNSDSVVLTDPTTQSNSGTATTLSQALAEGVIKDSEQDSQIAQIEEAIQAIAQASMEIESVASFDLVGHTDINTAYVWDFQTLVASDDDTILDADDVTNVVSLVAFEKRYFFDYDIVVSNTKNSDASFTFQKIKSSDNSPVAPPYSVTIPRDTTNLGLHFSEIVDTEIDAGLDFYYKAWSTADSTYITIGDVKTTIISGKGALMSDYPYADTKEPTGFTDPFNINESYNPTLRTITLSGTVKAFYHGSEVSALTSGWVSDPHPDTLGTNYFLYYNGTDFVWSTSSWLFEYLQIAEVAYYSDRKFAVREVHGFMDFRTHEECHYNIGTWRKSGGNFTSFVLSSTTSTDRRPTLESSLIVDEDIPTTIASSTSGTYCRFSLSGADTPNYLVDQTDIVSVDGSGRPNYNLFTGGVWTTAVMANNEYQKIFVVNIPVTSDVESQKYRTLYILGQSVSSSLAVTKAISPSSVSWGSLDGAGVNEYVFVGEIIIKASVGDWVIQEINVITGNRISQITTPVTNENAFTQNFRFSRAGFVGSYSGGDASIPYTSFSEDGATLLAGSGVISPVQSRLTAVTFQFNLMAGDATAKYRINRGSWITLGTVTGSVRGNRTFTPLDFGSVIFPASQEIEFGFNGSSNGSYTEPTVTAYVREP